MRYVLLLSALMVGCCLLANAPPSGAQVPKKECIWCVIEKDDPKTKAAVKVAEARVKIVETDLEGFEKERELLGRKYQMILRLRASRAVSEEEFMEVSRVYGKSGTDMARAKARVEEAKALLEYGKVTGQIDLSPSLR